MNLALHVGDVHADVLANRRAAARGVGAHGLASFEAVHGGRCVRVHAPGIVSGADAIITDVPGLALLAMGADCATLAIIGGTNICAVHCGWRGLVADVVGHAVASMRDVDDIHRVIVGPAICGLCYPIPQQRADLVAASPAQGPDVIVRTPDGQPGIDVRAGVHARLESLGVPADIVVDVPGCTAEDPGLFSVRRDGRTGRHGLLVAIEHDDAPRDGVVV